MRSPERDLVAHRFVAVGAISLSFLVSCCPVAFWADRGVVFSRARFGVQCSTRVRGSHVSSGLRRRIGDMLDRLRSGQGVGR